MPTYDRITEYKLQEKCADYAREIFDEAIKDIAATGETSEKYRDDMIDRAHEYADGSPYVIYYHRAHELCLFCDITMGEAFLDDIGVLENPTYDRIACLLAYGEIHGRIVQEIDSLIEAWEPAE